MDHTLIRKSLIALAAGGLMASGVALADDASSTPKSDSMGAAITDTAITAKVKAKFLGSDQMKGTNIDVKTTNGVVTLSGTAPNSTEKDAAEQIAKSTDGVKSVDDQVSSPGVADTVASSTDKAAKKTKGYAKDSWITTKVKSKLLADSITKGLDISVETNMGVVKLSGALPTQAQIDRAVAIAKAVKHVKSVDSGDLKVKVASSS